MGQREIAGRTGLCQCQLTVIVHQIYKSAGDCERAVSEFISARTAPDDIALEVKADQLLVGADAVNVALEEQYFVLAVMTKNRDFEFQGINTDGMKPGEFNKLVQNLIVKVPDLDPNK